MRRETEGTSEIQPEYTQQHPGHNSYLIWILKINNRGGYRQMHLKHLGINLEVSDDDQKKNNRSNETLKYGFALEFIGFNVC